MTQETKQISQGEPPKRAPMPFERETPNPLPDKGYSREQPPSTEGDENDPEIQEE